jgi:predicted NAD/FAD-binding protein
MDRKTKALLFLAGAGLGGLTAGYLLLRSRREEVREAARRTREFADRADRLAAAMERMTETLGAPVEEEDRVG